MGDHSMSGGDDGDDGDKKEGQASQPGLKETPIDKFFGHAERGPSDYVYASLPYMRSLHESETLYSRDEAYRMTSVYDCRVGTTTTDQNGGAGVANATVIVADGSDATLEQARWFDYYAGMYNYYHVVGARWWYTFENQSTDDLWVHTMYINDTAPSTLATSEDMQLWRDCRSHLVPGVANAILSTGIVERNDVPQNARNSEAGPVVTTPNFETGNHVAKRGRSNILTVSGTYRTGQFKRQIILDSEVENWTSTAANPALSERLLIRIKHRNDGIDDFDANSYMRPMTYYSTFKIEYLVEFKELKDGLRWPIERQPLTVTIAQDPGSGTE